MSQNDTNFYQNNQRNQSIKLISKNNPQMIINSYPNETTNRSLVNSIVPICNQQNELCCVLCGLAENTMLALGKLSKFKATFQFNSNNFINLKNILLNSNSNDSNNTKIISNNYKSSKLKVSILLKLGVKAIPQLLLNDISKIGWTMDPNIKNSDIFDMINDCFCVHYNCFIWSVGLQFDHDNHPINIDKVVYESLTKKCSICDLYGASVKCLIPECTQIFHYSCAVLAGCYQNLPTHRILCPDHTNQSNLYFNTKCLLCDSSERIAEQLFCTNCGFYYHSKCLSPQIEINPLIRIGWQCPECKICQACHKPENEPKMVICENCDKCYHSYCLKNEIFMLKNSTGWKCDPCKRELSLTRACLSCKGLVYKDSIECLCETCQEIKRNLNQENNKKRSVKDLLQLSRSQTNIASVDFTKTILKKEPVSDLNVNVTVKTEIPSQVASKPFSSSAPKPSIATKKKQIPKKNQNRGAKRSGQSSTNQVSISTRGTRSRNSGKDPKTDQTKRFEEDLDLQKKKNSGNDEGSIGTIKRDEDDHHAVTVISSLNDSFNLKQDMCLSCGSFGKGESGVILPCSQCGQCFHSFCAGVNGLSDIMLQKGWRCLDCTVCEGCGKATDESRLLLCDDCDISYHIYCLDPPLDQVPQGNWKCKWCVKCIKCGSKSPGKDLEWKNNYSECAYCYSLSCCHVCEMNYSESDIVGKCIKCQRWSHVNCRMQISEEDAEKKYGHNFKCSKCSEFDKTDKKLNSKSSNHIENNQNEPLLFMEEIINMSKKCQIDEGTFLTDLGAELMKKIKIKPLPCPRRRPPKTNSQNAEFDANKIVDENSQSSTDDKPESVHEEIHGDIETGSFASAQLEIKKQTVPPKRQINFGMGGFYVKSRRIRPQLSQPEGTESNENENKVIQKRKKKFTYEDMIPSYMQEAFFGSSTLNACQDVENDFDEPAEKFVQNAQKIEVHKVNLDENLFKLAQQNKKESLELGIEDFLDGDIVSYLFNENRNLIEFNPEHDLGQKNRSNDEKMFDDKIYEDLLHQIASSDPGQKSNPVDEYLNLNHANETYEHKECPETINHNRNIDDLARQFKESTHKYASNQAHSSMSNIDMYHNHAEFLNIQDPVINKVANYVPEQVMARPAQIDQAKINHNQYNFIMNHKMESNQVPNPQNAVFPNTKYASYSGENVAYQQQVQENRNFPAQQQQQQQQIQAQTQVLPSPQPKAAETPVESQISFEEQESSNDGFNNSGAKTNQNTQNKEAKEDLSKHQKMLEKYAEDEDLGEMATQAMPLYSNINFPNLKNEIKDVQERYRYVNKIWRKLDSQVKLDYINKSRQNRYKKKSDEKVASKAKARVKSPLNSDADNLRSRSATPSISMEDTNENSQASHPHTMSINQLGHGQILLCPVPNQQMSQNQNQIKQMDQIIHHHLQQQQLQQQQQQMNNKQEKITIKSYLTNQMNANMSASTNMLNQQHFSNQFQFCAAGPSQHQERSDQNEAKKNDTVSDHIDSIIEQVVAGSGTIPNEIDWDDDETNSSFKEFVLSQAENQSNNSTDRPSKSKKKPNKSSEDSGQAKSTKNKKRQKNDSESANLQPNQASSQPLVNQMSQFVQQNPQIIDPSKLNVNLNHRPLTTNSATKINEILMINSQNQQQQQQHQQSLTQNFHQLNSNSNVFIIPSTNQFNLQETQSANVNKLPYREDNLKKILSIPGNDLVINEAPMQNQNFNIHDLKNNIMVKNLLVSPSEQQQMSQQQPQSNSMQTISQNNNLKYLQLDGQIDEFDQPKGQPQMSASSHMVNSGENGQNFHKQESHFSSKLSNKVVINHELLNSYGITYNPNTQSSTYSQSSQDAQNFAIMNQSYVNKSDNTLLKQLLNTAPKNAVPESKPEIKTENIPPSTQVANSEKVKKPKNEKPRSQKPKQQNKLLSDLKNKIESNISEDDNPRKRKNTKANQEMSNETLINRILDELKSFGLLSMCQPKIDHNDEIYQNVSLPEKDHLLKFRHYNLNHFGNMYNLKISIEPRQFKENILEDIENKITTYNKKNVQQSVKICSANLTRPPSVDTNRELMTDSSNRLHRLLESEATSEKMFDEDSNMTDYSGQVLLKEPSSPRIDLQLNEIKKEATEPTLSGDMVKTTFKLSQKAGLNFKETVEKLSEILNIDMPGVVHLGKIVKYESKLGENLKLNTNQETMYTMQSLSSTKFNTCSFCEGFLNEEKENIDGKILFCSKYCRLSFRKLLNLKKLKSQNQDIGHTVPARSECVPKKEKRLLRWSRDLLQNMAKNDNGMESEKFELLKANGYADSRTCVFCKQSGDLEQNGPCRLLSLDVDKWSHLNCALWSDEVYETMNGALINVEIAYKKSLNLQCCYCHEKGASLRCFSPKCNCFYHFPCAVKDKCAFNQDKTIYCSTHSCKALNENRLGDLSVKRSVWIQRDEVAQIQSFMIRDFDESAYAIRIGSLVLHNIGQLLPHQLSTGLFNNRDYIYPVGYRATRIYWSTKSCFKRCQYLCSIEEVDGRPEFSVTITEETGDREVIVDKSPSDLWKRILERVELMRKHLDLVKLFPNYFSGEYMYGLAEPHVIRLVESLPGVETLTNYAFKFGKLQLLDMPLAINPTGSARSEPKLRTHFRKSRTLTCPTTVPNPVQRSESNASASGLNSNGLNLNQAADNVYDRVQDLSEDDEFVKMGADLDNNGIVAYSKQFVQSKSSQFRKLKAEWRQNVYLKKSKIQGLGLFAARDLEKNTMIIEYIGELIRNEVANRREKLYESQNRGIYMFRLNDELVVDATISGGLARYINHCCDPNCVAETVSVEKDQKIIIIANKKILKGEELTYDYQFEFEDESSKIQCLCGSANCKKWMN